MLDDGFLIAPLSPVVLATFAAFLFGLGAQFQNQGLAHMDSRSGATITISGSALIMLAMAPFLLNWQDLWQPAVLVFVLVGLFRPALSGNLALIGMRHLGPTLSTTLTSTAPLFGIAFGVLWLGETLNWATGLGTGIIVGAIMLLARRGGARSVGWPVWALLLPIAAAALRSLGHVLSKVGMESVPDPYIAALVGFVVSALVTAGLQTASRAAPPVFRPARGTGWFLGASCCYSTALMALNTALLNGKVIEVVPVIAASPIVTLILSVLLFHRERITARTVVVVLMVVPAVILIGVSG